MSNTKFKAFGKIFTFLKKLKNTAPEIVLKIGIETTVEFIKNAGKQMLLKLIFIFLIALFGRGYYSHIIRGIEKFSEKLNLEVNKLKKDNNKLGNEKNGSILENFVEKKSLDVVTHIFTFLDFHTLRNVAAVRMSWVHPSACAIQKSFYQNVCLSFEVNQHYINSVKEYAQRVKRLELRKFIESRDKNLLQLVHPSVLDMVNIHIDYYFINILELIQPKYVITSGISITFPETNGTWFNTIKNELGKIIGVSTVGNWFSAEITWTWFQHLVQLRELHATHKVYELLYLEYPGIMNGLRRLCLSVNMQNWCDLWGDNPSNFGKTTLETLNISVNFEKLGYLSMVSAWTNLMQCMMATPAETKSVHFYNDIDYVVMFFVITEVFNYMRNPTLTGDPCVTFEIWFHDCFDLDEQVHKLLTNFQCTSATPILMKVKPYGIFIRIGGYSLHQQIKEHKQQYMYLYSCWGIKECNACYVPLWCEMEED